MRSWVEISESRLRHNLSLIRRYLAEARPQPHEADAPAIIAVVKADAYGHGLDLVTPILYQEGIRHFAVAHLDEAEALGSGVGKDELFILVLGGIQEGRENDFRRLGATASVFDSRPHPSGVPAHLKIDTGMGRLGIPPEDVPAYAARLGDALTGVFSHLHSADQDPEETRRQIDLFLRCTDLLNEGSSGPIFRHLSASPGLPYPASHLDAVRIGLALYGIDPSGEVEGLLPILAWKSRILTIKDVPAGSTIGYGATHRCTRDTRVGVIPVGYADGYSRHLSNRAHVEVQGCAAQSPTSNQPTPKGASASVRPVVEERGAGAEPERLLAPVIGRVSMDLITIDLTGHPDIAPGTQVTLLSPDPEAPCSAQSLAALQNTIPYEVLTSIGPRTLRQAVR